MKIRIRHPRLWITSASGLPSTKQRVVGGSHKASLALSNVIALSGITFAVEALDCSHGLRFSRSSVTGVESILSSRDQADDIVVSNIRGVPGDNVTGGTIALPSASKVRSRQWMRTL
ncbi:hypothetical protein IF803_37105 [Bradyrhizobium sp. UFLA06-06]